MREAGRKVYKAEDVDKKIQDISIPDFVSLEKMVFGDKEKLAAAIDADDMTKKTFAHTQRALLRVEEKTAQLATTMADIKAAIKDLEVQTGRIRKASQAAGEEYDKRHGTAGKGAAAGVLYGEASAFVATAQAAHDQGQREKAEAGRVQGEEPARSARGRIRTRAATRPAWSTPPACATSSTRATSPKARATSAPATSTPSAQAARVVQRPGQREGRCGDRREGGRRPQDQARPGPGHACRLGKMLGMF